MATDPLIADAVTTPDSRRAYRRMIYQETLDRLKDHRDLLTRVLEEIGCNRDAGRHVELALNQLIIDTDQPAEPHTHTQNQRGTMTTS